MTIYISHATNFDFKNELYLPIRKASINNQYTFILPHETNNMPYETKALFASKKCNLIIAECSHPSTGQGIELGYADMLKIPVVCLYKYDAKISGSLKIITDIFLTYNTAGDMIETIERYLKKNV